MASTQTHESLKQGLFDLLEAENRPYAFDDILKKLGEKLGEDVDRKAAEKAIKSLVAKDTVIGKKFGNLAVYCINNKIDEISKEEVSEP